MIGKVVSFLYPWVIPIIILLIIPENFNYKIKNFADVLESVVTFSSIIVGFLGALLGILITIKNTKIIKEIHKENEMGTVRYYFKEALILGFIVVILSIIFQVLKDYDYDFILYYFYFWFIFTTTFAISSFRVIQLLMNIFFKSSKSSDRPTSNVEELDFTERDKIKQELKKHK